MKILKLAALALASLAAVMPGRADDLNTLNATTNVAVEITAIALPKDQALAFTAKHDMNGKAEEALKELQGMVARESAVSETNVAITTTGGQRAVSDSGQVTLEAEPIIMKDGHMDVNLRLASYKDEITAAVQGLKSGELKYIGAINSADAGATRLAFMRVIVGR